MISLQGVRQRHWTSSFWKLNSFPRNVRHTFQLSQMMRRKHVSCCMSQEKPSLTQVVDECFGALTLEAHRSVMGDQGKEIVWHYDTPSVFCHYGNGTKDRSIGVIDLPCVVGGQTCRLNACCSRRSSLSAEQELVEREWCCSEYLVRGAVVDKETNHCPYV